MRIACIVVLALGSAASATAADLAEVAVVGHGTSGALGVPELALSAPFGVGQPVPTLRLLGGAPSSMAQLIVGVPGPPEPLPAFGATLYAAAPRVRLTAPLDSDGASPPWFAQPAALPASLSGLAYALQGVVVDASATGGLAFTAGLHGVVGSGSSAAALFDGAQLLAADAPVASAKLAAGDLDGNGRTDALVVFADGAFALGLSLDDGTLVPATPPAPSALAPTSLVLADLDADGALDLLLAGDGGFETRPGLGDATFGAASVHPFDGLVGTCEVADVDGDGVSDVLGALRDLGAAAWLRGLGAGDFAAMEVVAAGITFASDLAVGDVDADGDLDLALLDALVPFGSGTVSVLLGDGTGAFATPSTFAPSPAHANPRAVALGDLDGDGDDDLVVGSAGGGFPFTPGRLESRLADGTGGFGPSLVSDAAQVADLALLDLDADGVLDAFVEGNAPSHVPGIGDGTFGVPIVLAGSGSLDAVPIDLDGDALPDLLGVDGNPLVFAVLDGAQSTPLLVLPKAKSFALVDLDADGDLDVVGLHAGSGGEGLDVALGDGAGAFDAPVFVPTVEEAGWLAVADLDGDGLPDALTTEGFFGRLRLYPGTGTGDFAAPVTLPDDGTLPVYFELVDLDADGDLDILTFDYFTHAAAPRLGDGAGGFASGPATPLGLSAYAFVTGDLDADGFVDLVVSVEDAAWVDVRAGLGNGAFGPPTSLPTAHEVGVAGVADVDGDGAADLLLASRRYSPDELLSLPGRLAVHRGLGGMAFAAPAVSVTPPGISWITAVDLDLDGALDLALSTGSGVTVLLGFGNGAFAAAQAFGAPAGIVLAGDVDADGDLDLVSSAQSKSALLENRLSAAPRGALWPCRARSRCPPHRRPCSR